MKHDVMAGVVLSSSRINFLKIGLNDEITGMVEVFNRLKKIKK